MRHYKAGITEPNEVDGPNLNLHLTGAAYTGT